MGPDPSGGERRRRPIPRPGSSVGTSVRLKIGRSTVRSRPWPPSKPQVNALKRPAAFLMPGGLLTRLLTAFTRTSPIAVAKTVADSAGTREFSRRAVKSRGSVPRMLDAATQVDPPDRLTRPGLLGFSGLVYLFWRIYRQAAPAGVLTFMGHAAVMICISTWDIDYLTQRDRRDLRIRVRVAAGKVMTVVGMQMARAVNR